MREQIFRHGDMIIFKVKEIPSHLKAVKKKDKLVVGLGEVTGHSHDILPVDNGEITTFVENETVTENELAEMNSLFFEITEGAGIIVHEEHDPIQLGKGKYLRMRQVEFNPFTKQLENVRD